MLHLSLLTLPRNTTQWKFLLPYDLHQVLWKGFKGIDRGEKGKEQRFLYRHQESEDSHSILVQSATTPDWSFLADEASGTTAAIKQINPGKLPAGQPLRFLLRANPVVHRKYGGNIKKRIAVGSDRRRQAELRGIEFKDMPSREALLIEWLEKKGSEGGFSIARGEQDRILCDVGPNMDIVLRKPKQTSKDGRVTLTTIDFSGVLTVTDPQQFAQTLRRGIGRGRAFGCGLLSVTRL